MRKRLLVAAALAVVLLAALYLAFRSRRLDDELRDAVIRRDIVAAVAALDRGANANVRLAPGAAPRLTLATLLRAFFQLAPRYDDPGEPVLAVAVRNDDARMAAALLDHGADPNSRQADGRPVICVAAGRADAQVVRMLLAHHIRVDEKAQDGCTAMHVATQAAAPDVIDLLASARANVDQTSAKGDTPLMVAVRFDVPNAIDRLLAHRAKLPTAPPKLEIHDYDWGPGPHDGATHWPSVLAWASATQSAPLVRAAWNETPTEKRASVGPEALRVAIEQNSSEAVAALLDLGVPINRGGGRAAGCAPLSPAGITTSCAS